MRARRAARRPRIHESKRIPAAIRDANETWKAKGRRLSGKLAALLVKVFTKPDNKMGLGSRARRIAQGLGGVNEIEADL